MIPERTVQEILAVAQVDEVIEDYIQLKRRGANMLGLCPFHNEKTPSFTVSPSKNLWKCFGCGRGGSVVNFLMEHESFTYPEALKYLAKKYNIEVIEKELSPEAQKEIHKKESLLVLNQYANEFFRHQLLQTDEGKSIGLSYLKHRGLSERTIELFELGYSPKSSTAFVDQATKDQHNLVSMQELGLISQNNRDFFRERVIFPFHNLSGKVIGFGGRILTNDKKAPKYLNSPESELYNKRKTLYGLYQARLSIRSEDFCILVEGYTDVLSLSQNGIENVVASSGTALTNEQVRLIKRFTKDVVVLYDGDAAGQKAALRGLDIFLENEMNVKVLSLPPGEDPDTYMRSIGPTSFKEILIKESKDFIILLASNIEENYANDPVNKSIQIKELTTSIAKIIDPLKRSLYVKECTRKLNLDEDSLTREINKQIHQILKTKKQESSRDNNRAGSDTYEVVERKKDLSGEFSMKSDPIIVQERDIIRILIRSCDKVIDPSTEMTVAQYIIQNLNGVIEFFRDDISRRIMTFAESQISNNHPLTQESFLHHEDEEIVRSSTHILIEKYEYADWAGKGVELQTQKPYDDNFIKESYQSLMRLKLRLIQNRISELLPLLHAANDDHQKNVLLTVHQKLLQDRQNLATELGVTVF